MTSFSMMTPNFNGARCYRVAKHGIGLNMFYTLREVSQLNELCAGFEESG
jgi:hypothetical protein